MKEVIILPNQSRALLSPAYSVLHIAAGSFHKEKLPIYSIRSLVITFILFSDLLQAAVYFCSILC